MEEQREQFILTALLREIGIEYGICDQDRRFIFSSPGLLALIGHNPSDTFDNQRLEEVFAEFNGVEDTLIAVAQSQDQVFVLPYVRRVTATGTDVYLKFIVTPIPAGLLLIIYDVTTEGNLMQRTVQEHNQLALVQNELNRANMRLAYLLEHVVPENVAKKIMAMKEPPSLGGRQTLATVLFADIRNYTAIADRQAPEDLIRFLNRHFAIIGSAILHHGGTITQYAGDMIMASFNVPDAQSDHALRAVTAAAEAQTNLRNLRRDSPPQETVAEFGIGIETGIVVSGFIGFENRYDYTTLGRTTNIAFRLSSFAKGGQILIGPQTHQLVSPHWPTLSTGTIPMKGAGELIPVFQLQVP